MCGTHPIAYNCEMRRQKLGADRPVRMLGVTDESAYKERYPCTEYEASTAGEVE